MHWLGDLNLDGKHDLIQIARSWPQAVNGYPFRSRPPKYRPECHGRNRGLPRKMGERRAAVTRLGSSCDFRSPKRGEVGESRKHQNVASGAALKKQKSHCKLCSLARVRVLWLRLGGPVGSRVFAECGGR
jgi:hypothetical protein